MMGWQDAKTWSDQYLPHVKRILGEYLIGEAPIQDDAERNTDLIVLTLSAVRIGCRIRRRSYLERYGDEFTIRASLPSGNRTELSKIIEGWGDYFFYGIVADDDDASSGFAAWLLGDLNAFRRWHAQQLFVNRGILPGALQKNGDGSSQFRAYKIDAMPNSFIVARHVQTYIPEIAY